MATGRLCPSLFFSLDPADYFALCVKITPWEIVPSFPVLKLKYIKEVVRNQFNFNLCCPLPLFSFPCISSLSLLCGVEK